MADLSQQILQLRQIDAATRQGSCMQTRAVARDHGSATAPRAAIQSQTGAPFAGRPICRRTSLKKFVNSCCAAVAGCSTRAMNPPLARTKLVTSTGFQRLSVDAAAANRARIPATEPSNHHSDVCSRLSPKNASGIVERDQSLVRIVDDDPALPLSATIGRCWRADWALSFWPSSLLVKTLP